MRRCWRGCLATHTPGTLKSGGSLPRASDQAVMAGLRRRSTTTLRHLPGWRPVCSRVRRRGTRHACAGRGWRCPRGRSRTEGPDARCLGRGDGGVEQGQADALAACGGRTYTECRRRRRRHAAEARATAIQPGTRTRCRRVDEPVVGQLLASRCSHVGAAVSNVRRPRRRRRGSMAGTDGVLSGSIGAIRSGLMRPSPWSFPFLPLA